MSGGRQRKMGMRNWWRWWTSCFSDAPSFFLCHSSIWAPPGDVVSSLMWAGLWWRGCVQSDVAVLTGYVFPFRMPRQLCNSWRFPCRWVSRMYRWTWHTAKLLASYFLSLGEKGNLSVGYYYLCMFELQLGELHQVLPECRNSSCLEVNELWGQKTERSDPVETKHRNRKIRGNWTAPNKHPSASPCLADSEIFSNLWQQSCWVVSACRTSLFLDRALSRALLAFS